jgi:hypothetical protein
MCDIEHTGFSKYPVSIIDKKKYQIADKYQIVILSAVFTEELFFKRFALIIIFDYLN